MIDGSQNVILTKDLNFRVWEVHPDDGKQPKTFGFDLLILQFLTF